MHYELHCAPLASKRPITLQGQEYSSLEECPDWVDGIIARTAYAYVSEAAHRNTPVEVAQRRLHDITGQQEAFSCYLALAVLEMGDDDQLTDYVIMAVNDLKLKSNVKFAYDGVIDAFALSGYMSFSRKSKPTLDRLAFLRKMDTHPFIALSIAFDDVPMADRLIKQSGHDFEYTLSYLASSAHFPYCDSKIRDYLAGCLGNIRDQEIEMRLELQKAMSGGRMIPHTHAGMSLDEAPPYAAYDFRDKSLVNMKPLQTPGFEQWVKDDQKNLNALAKSLNYSSASRLEGRATTLIDHYEQSLGILLDNMPWDQVYMQACLDYSPGKVALAKQYHQSEKDLHRDLHINMIAKLRDKDPLCNRIAQIFIDHLGLAYVLDRVENQDDVLEIAKHYADSSVRQRLTPDQRDTLMGRDLGM